MPTGGLSVSKPPNTIHPHMEPTYSLQSGTLLQGHAYRYRIERVLGQGSFGITYLATGYVTVQGPLGNVETQVPVAIKEFFMQELSSRDSTGSLDATTDRSLVQKYARKFSVEARNLSRIKHPGIVSVLDFIDANNTFYYVMEFVEGGSLDEHICSQGGLSEEEALASIRQIGEALAHMHAHKMLHLDLKPKNVMRKADGHLLLIDFGLSKQYDGQGEPESSTTIGMGTPGYAPIEQADASTGREFSPTLDVYALGATFFKMLTGETPPKASDIINFGLPLDKLRERGVSEASVAAVEKAMQFRRSDRTPTVDAFLKMLPGTPQAPADEERTAIREPGKPFPFASGTDPLAPAAKTAGESSAANRKQHAATGNATPGKAQPKGGAKKAEAKKKMAVAISITIIVLAAGTGLFISLSGSGKGNTEAPTAFTTDTTTADADTATADTAALHEAEEPVPVTDTIAAPAPPAGNDRHSTRKRTATLKSASTASRQTYSPTAAGSSHVRSTYANSSTSPATSEDDLEKKPKKKWKQKLKKIFHKKDKE